MIRITLDPGHGGRRPGAIGPTGLQEKVVVLAVALRVRELLRLHGHTEAHLTRETDVDVPLTRRLAEPGVVCFISIHCNAHATRAANGTETFYYAQGHVESRRLAQLMQIHLTSRLRLHDRGVKTANFQVIRQATIPAVLVELGFISNSDEEALLKSEQGQEKSAQAIVAGVKGFLSVRPACPLRTHTVVSGDTLWEIAKQYHVQPAQLRQWNRLVTDTLQIGQQLVIEVV